MKRFVIALAAIVAFALLGGAALWAVRAQMNPNSYTSCDRFDKAAAATAGILTQTPPGDEREALVAQLADLRQQAEDDGCGIRLPVPSATPTASPSPSATQPEDEEPAASDSWTPHFYTLDPGKTGERNFGPPIKGGKKAAAGNADAIADINAEFHERMLKDPALLCGNGGLILKGKDGGKACVDKLIASKSARDKYFDRVFDEIESTAVKKRLPQRVESAYMVVPNDGVPRIVKSEARRTSTYYVLVVKTTSGKSYSFRLECGFQWDTGRKVVPRTYTPVKHPPYTPVPPCVNGGDRDEDGKCVVPPKETTPPAETPTPTATPTATPTETPTASPSPTPTTPTPTPTPTPSCRNKECETPVAPPSNRPAPSSTPTRSPEDSPPPAATHPADTATPTVTAPGATQAPEPDPESPVPTVSQPGGGDEPIGGDPGDPDDN